MRTKLFKYFMPYEQSKAFEFNNDCTCGARADPSYIYKPDLLKGPIKSKCIRHTIFDQKTCFNEWSVAIPLDPDYPERKDIEHLVVLGHERDMLLDRLKEIEDFFIEEGKKDND